LGVLDTYKLAGRSENDARGRVLLEGPGRFEKRNILELGENLGFGAGGMVNIISGKEEAAALVLDACQKRVYSQGLDLDVYRMARDIELNYLRAFLRSGANTVDRSSIEKTSLRRSLKHSARQMRSETKFQMFYCFRRTNLAFTSVSTLMRNQSLSNGS
jgi:hypothetical protein